MKPLVEGLEKTYAGKVEFRRLNSDGSDANANALAEKLAVQYVPTFFFVNADGSISKSVVGEMSQGDLAAAVAALK
jgi:thioredoxin-related protein